MKRAATAAEKRHLDRVAKLPCAVCGAWPVQVHHIREGFGMGQRAPHALTLPLCPEHHQGKTGIHGDRSAWRLRNMTELSALADTILKLETMENG
jgi:hypothetical protein